MLETILGALPEVAKIVLDLFEDAGGEGTDAGNFLALATGRMLARAVPDKQEDEVGKFLRASGQALIDANK